MRTGRAVAQGSAPIELAEAFLALDLPTIRYLHDVEFDRLRGEIPLDRRLRVLSNSRFTAQRAWQEPEVESHVVPPLIRPETDFVEARGEKVLFVNPHPWQGVDLAFRLAENRPDIPFLFVDPDAGAEVWLEALSRLWDDRQAYERLSEAALEHSRRRDIQGDTVSARFIELAADHVEATRAQLSSA